jgi:hypothetical protein
MPAMPLTARPCEPGLLDLVTATRARAFEGAALQLFD